MRVTIKLFADFRQGRFAVKACDFAVRVTILQVVEELAIPLAEVGILLCNGLHVDFETELVEGDICSIFPKVGGG